jgi:dienelactone hydrolase
MAEELDGFTRSTFEHGGYERSVYAAGSGPAVIVIHEMPGLHPGVIDFGRRVVDRGFHVRMPSLFGTPGKPFSWGYVLRTFPRGCVAREFTTWALNRTSPVTAWLRALAADAHAARGGPGVGAVGMCFTGGFALGMMVDDRMLAPVLSQPSLPLPFTPRRFGATGVSDADLDRVRARAGACLLGLRFTADPIVRAERFQTLRDALGDRFLAVEIDSSKGNADGIRRWAHSVLTLDLVDEPGHPTADALERTLSFLEERLRG